jgi:hypothetical protein
LLSKDKKNSDFFKFSKYEIYLTINFDLNNREEISPKLLDKFNYKNQIELKL